MRSSTRPSQATSHNEETDTLSSSQSTEREIERERLSVLIISSFYSGHIIPLLAVGEELVSRGHVVSFLTTEVNGSNLVPAVPIQIGMKFISAGPDPRTRLEYEQTIYNLKGMSLMEQLGEISALDRDHTLPLRIACDQLNMSKWNIIVADIVAKNLVRYLDIKWSPRIILSVAVATDLTSIDSQWPSPSIHCVGCSEDMSFWQRFVDTLLHKNSLVRYFSLRWTKSNLAGNDEVLWAHISRDSLKNFAADEFHPSLLYTAVGVEYARPAYPGVHMVGPVLRRNIPPLDKNLESWLANKKGKVIYVSMGTTALVTETMAESFVEGISVTDYSVVWSLRESNQDILKDMIVDSFRFYIASWVSQVAVLQHRAVELSILHCGTGGIHEALYFEVPIICIPFWYDQFSWANRIRDQGLGVVLYAHEISPKSITDNIHKIEHSDFKKRVAKVGKILRNAGGSVRAADLVEHYADVGYEHLVPAYVKYRWSWLQFYNMDVYTVIWVFVVFSVLIVWILCMYCVRKICCMKCRHKAKND